MRVFTVSRKTSHKFSDASHFEQNIWLQIQNRRLTDRHPASQRATQPRRCNKTTANAVKTRSSADADKLARRVYRTVKVTKHSIIPHIRYSNFDFKRLRFYDIRLRKML